VTDSQTGFRVLKRKVFENIRLESDGYEVETEITMKSLKNGFTFKEVPSRLGEGNMVRRGLGCFLMGERFLAPFFG